MTFEELINLPVVEQHIAPNIMSYHLYCYEFLLEERFSDSNPAARVLNRLNSRVEILYQDDNEDQGGQVVVFYFDDIPTVVYQAADSWNEDDDQLFVLDRERYQILQTELANEWAAEESVYTLQSEVPNLFRAEPSLIDGKLWHPRGTPRKYDW